MEVVEVAGVGGRVEQLLEDGSDVVEGSDGRQGRLGVGSQETSEGGEAQSGFDEVEGGAAAFEVAGEESIAGADVAEGVGQVAVAVEDALDVEGHPWGSRREGP